MLKERGFFATGIGVLITEIETLGPTCSMKFERRGTAGKRRYAKSINEKNENKE